MKPYLRHLPVPTHISHRGGAAVAPENTLPAFEAAVQTHRTHVLELDVQPTADGHVVVLHDDTLERTTNGQGPVLQNTLAQVQNLDAGFHHTAWRGRGVQVPTLEQVLRHFPNTPINMELKNGTPAFMSEVVSILARHQALERVCLGHIHEDTSLLLRNLAPDAAFWFPETAATLFVMCTRSQQEPPPSPWDVLELPDRMGDAWVVDADLLRVAHARGIPVQVWTVDVAADMHHLLDLGVDGIMSDRPDVLRAVLDGRRAGASPKPG